MTRFVMSIEEAVSLVLNAGAICEGGEVFILKMDVLRIDDLIRIIAEDLGSKCGRKVRTKIIGIRPGEKLYEELLTEDESLLVEDIGDMYVLRSGAKPGAKRKKVIYNSQECSFMTDAQIRKKLRDIGYLE
jgi:FlaA1/EpsC-like NDP-sugar epimerase